MLNHENFAVSLGRAVETIRAQPDAIQEQKSQLRALVALTKFGSATVMLGGEALTVEGTTVPPAFPGIRTLTQQMEGHLIREVRIAQNASAADLLALVRALAVNIGGFEGDGGFEERMRASRATSVTVLSVREDKLAASGRPVSVTEAFEIGPILEAAKETSTVAESSTPSAPPQSALSAALAKLNAEYEGANVLDQASAVAQLVLEALQEDRIEEAVDAIANLVRLEDGLEEGSPRRSLGIVLRRVLTGKALARVAKMALDARHRDAAIAVLRRGGADGTEVLLHELGEANSLAERRAFFDALREMTEGARQILHLMEHHEWFVVRNVAELIGELRLGEGVPALGKALSHHEPRVRRAAAGALAQIGTAPTVEPLRRALRDADREIRITVAAALGGKRAAQLAMPLVLAAEGEDDEEVLREFCRALGRIGTADALQALIKMVQPGGRILKRKAAGPRLAAIDGLKASGSAAAIGTLEGLAGDNDKDVRQAVERALQDLQQRK